MNGEQILLVQFAVDLGLLMEYDQRSWDQVQIEFSKFEHSSGMKINYNKSVVYRMESVRHTNAKFYSMRKLQWSDCPIKILGIILDNDKDNLIKANLDPLIEKSQVILDLWSKRGLTLFGKIQVVNSLVGSLFTYPFTVLPKIPLVYFNRINKIIKEFIWDKKKSKIRIEVLQKSKIDAGAGLIDLQAKAKALQLQWVYKINTNQQLRSIANALLSNRMGDLIWTAQLSKKICAKYIHTTIFGLMSYQTG